MTLNIVIGGTFMTVNYRRYDPRLKNLVAESKDIERFRKYGIPDSSLRQWVKDGLTAVLRISIPMLTSCWHQNRSRELSHK